MRRVTISLGPQSPAVVAWLNDSPSLDTDWLSGYFAEAASRGVRFDAGQTVQLGWMIAKLVTDADGNLELWEPDFRSMPVVWQKGVSATLRQLVLQRAVCDQASAVPSFPSLAQSAVVASDFQDHPGELAMSREEGMGNDSGWLLATPSSSDHRASLRSLYEVSLRRPDIIPFLALPAGASVEWRHRQIDINIGPTRFSSSSSDLLRGLVDSAFAT